jgi:hypothetical protein
MPDMNEKEPSEDLEKLRALLLEIIPSLEPGFSERWDALIVKPEERMCVTTDDPTAIVKLVHGARNLVVVGTNVSFESQCPICGAKGEDEHMGSCLLMELRRMLRRPTFVDNE